MAIVLNIGEDVNLIRAGKKTRIKNSYYGVFDKEILYDSSLLKEFLLGLKQNFPELSDEPVYVTLSSGSGVIYKTITLPADNLMVNGNRTTVEDMREAARDYFKEQFPFGFEEEYISTVVSECKNYTDYIMCCAYIPKQIVDNIFNAFFEADVALFNVYPLTFGIYKAFDFNKFGQAIVDIGKEVMLVNGLGVIIWNKHEDYSSYITYDYLVNQSKALYDIDNDVAGTEMYKISDIGNLLVSDCVENVTEVSAYTVAAFGLLYNSAKLRGVNVEKKGGGEGVVSKLRFLFNGKAEK